MLGALPPKDPLEGIEVKIRVVKAVNTVQRSAAEDLSPPRRLMRKPSLINGPRNRTIPIQEDGFLMLQGNPLKESSWHDTCTKWISSAIP
jgi:hypothetical protein